MLKEGVGDYPKRHADDGILSRTLRLTLTYMCPV